MWHQVIDHSGSYREMTSTCMITFAILRGLKHGWLEESEYLPITERAWEAIKLTHRHPTASSSTSAPVPGKQNTLRDYLDRTAILGRDERGGAMALIVSVEMAELQAAR